MIQSADLFRKSDKGKKTLAQRAKHLCATGVLRRKSPITDRERSAQSYRMKQNNPMKRPEIKEKRRHLSPERKAQLVDQARRLHAAGIFGHPPPMTEKQKDVHRKRMKENNPMRSFEVRQKVSRAIKKLYEQDRRSMVERWVNAGASPNKAELLLLNLIAPLGFRYTGDGQFWIGPCQSGRCRNPDFVYGQGDQKVAILLNGEYWHNLPKSDDEMAMKDYLEMGWRVLIIKDTELDRPLLPMITGWLHGVLSQV